VSTLEVLCKCSLLLLLLLLLLLMSEIYDLVCRVAYDGCVHGFQQQLQLGRLLLLLLLDSTRACCCYCGRGLLWVESSVQGKGRNSVAGAWVVQ
jgi:hypothetical protein